MWHHERDYGGEPAPRAPRTGHPPAPEIAVLAEMAGIIRDTLYLLRPDTYVGLVDRSCSVKTLQSYLDVRGTRLGRLKGREQKQTCWLKDAVNRLIVSGTRLLLQASVTFIPQKKPLALAAPLERNHNRDALRL